VQKTLAAFAEVGVQIKVLSGDHPQTVATLARQVGISGDDKVVAGSELEQMDRAQHAQVVEETTVFGR
jgi:magnesium-transporting ATPase (P-type)